QCAARKTVRLGRRSSTGGCTLDRGRRLQRLAWACASPTRESTRHARGVCTLEWGNRADIFRAISVSKPRSYLPAWGKITCPHFVATPTLVTAVRPYAPGRGDRTMSGAHSHTDPVDHERIDNQRPLLLENGEEYFPAVFAAITAARAEVIIETFILFDDTVG